MIFAAAKAADGRPVAMLGLSAENVRRMIEGYPISIDCSTADVGVDLGVVIWGGWGDETELQNYLTEHFDVHHEHDEEGT